MSAIRNACVARGAAPQDTTTILYTVPAGYVFLLKSVLLRATSSTRPSEYAVYAMAPDGGFANIVDLPWPSQSFVNHQDWLVLNAGDQLGTYPTGAPVYYWISGAVLPYAASLPV